MERRPKRPPLPVPSLPAAAAAPVKMTDNSKTGSYLAVGLTVGLAPPALYALFLLLSAIPIFQRNFLYAHKINTLWWPGTNLNKPERWGFAKNQVIPFALPTPDGSSLYAWHILPLPLYAQHEDRLASQPGGFSYDVTTTDNFKLLRDDPTSKLIISFHGNAGHISQSHRPRHYHSLTDTTRYHLLAIDYRGFGHSTGSPTESGLILDAVTAIDWAINTAGVSPSRIVLLGQSLGTAVASAAAELYATNEGVDFAGVVLVAGFSSLPAMLTGYSIAGFLPVLRPLTWWPWLLKNVMARVVDRWESAARWRKICQNVNRRGGRLRLNLVHARNDWDIPAHEDDKLFRAAVSGLIDAGEDLDDAWLNREKESRTIRRGKKAFTATWREGNAVVRQELFPHGGHNDVTFYAPVLLAVMRSFET